MLTAKAQQEIARLAREALSEPTQPVETSSDERIRQALLAWYEASDDEERRWAMELTAPLKDVLRQQKASVDPRIIGYATVVVTCKRCGQELSAGAQKATAPTKVCDHGIPLGRHCMCCAQNGTACQHDLQKQPNTIEVDGERNARCTVCKTEWTLS